MKWFFGILLLLLAALLLESGLLAYAAYVLLGLLLLSRLMARDGMKNLSATRTCKLLAREDRPAEAPEAGLMAEVGERVSVEVTVRNGGRLLVPWVLVEDLLPRQALSLRFPRLKVKGKRLRIGLMRGGGELVLRYQAECLQRGYYQIGPVTLESGDLFGLHRRFKVETEPRFLLVLPRLVELESYDLISRRPIGEVRMTHRLFEDPTRIAGVRPYEAGDPLNRVHWRATARTGLLHSKLYEPSTLAGATLVLDFNQAGYHARGEPFRSELAVTTAASLANAVYLLGQQVGLVTNGRDAADRIRVEGWERDPRTRQAARVAAEMQDESDRLQPLRVETRRGGEQMQRIRETLARLELTDGLSFAELLLEANSRLPRDATVVAVLPDVPVETAIALGNLKRQGWAVTVVLIVLVEGELEKAHGRLLAEGLRDVRHLPGEEHLAALCSQQVQATTPYQLELE
jgi:uncharacterized protein (DUF58 family)